MGLSISQRIIENHGGTIEVVAAGAGRLHGALERWSRRASATRERQDRPSDPARPRRASPPPSDGHQRVRTRLTRPDDGLTSALPRRANGCSSSTTSRTCAACWRDARARRLRGRHAPRTASEALGASDDHIDLVITDLKMPQARRHGAPPHAVGRGPDAPGHHDHRARHRRQRRRGAQARRLRLHHQAVRQDEIRRSSPRRSTDATRSRARRRDAAAEPPGRGRFGIIGESPGIRSVYAIIEKVADTPSTVLITGESGTGKELVARALHEQLAARTASRSSRSTAPPSPRR